MRERTDDQLMLMTAKGELGAFGEIVLRYERSAWKLAFRFLNDSMEAEDAAQEAFLKVFDSASRYRPKGSFHTYFYSILIRTCIDHCRKRRPESSDDFSEIPDPAPNPAENLMARERAEQVRKALDLLPPTQKASIILMHYEGLTYREIADVLCISVKAAESLIDRARISLQKNLSSFTKN
ncbi:MAG: RNA polymerase sigma factor [Syntrophobacteraceae bacterium]